MCDILDDYTIKLKQFGAIQEKINKLGDLKLEEEFVNQEIRRLESEKAQIMMKLASIESAIEQLDEESKYLIQERYIKETSWEDIEESYNKTFRKKPPIRIRAMHKKIIKATKKLKEIIFLLEPVL